MTLHKIAKLALSVVCTPLIMISLGVWIFEIVFYREQWECIMCRADEPTSTKQNFLYYTLWNLFLTTALFVAWAGGWKTAAKRIFRVELPHACTVATAYIYYRVTFQNDEFFNAEDCYVRGRATLSKQITDSEAAVDAYMVFQNILNIFVHYVICPVMLLLLFSGELDYDLAFPYSTVFVTLLGLAIALSQTFGSKIYCGSIWFQMGMMILIHLVYHGLFVLWNRRICQRCISKKTEPAASKADEKEANTESESPKVMEGEA